MLYCLIYSSVSARTLENKDIQDILEDARHRNAGLDVTGLLLYYKRSFMQVLEGEREIVLDLFHQRIALDERHTCVHVIAEYEISDRRFNGWSMAFKNLDDCAAAELDGYSGFLEHGFTTEATVDEADVAQRFLLTFKENW